jgi:hypothetical protein
MGIDSRDPSCRVSFCPCDYGSCLDQGKVAKLKLDNPVLEKLKSKLNTYLDDAINTTNKKFVDKAKEVGIWDKVEGVFDNTTYVNNADKALNMCYDSLTATIPIEFQKLLTKYFGDVKQFLLSEIDRRMKERELEKEKEKEKATVVAEEVL